MALVDPEGVEVLLADEETKDFPSKDVGKVG